MAQIKWTPEEDSTLREHHARGHSLAAISEALDGMNIGHISRRMKRMGLTPNGKSTEPATQATRDRLAAQREQLASAVLADAIHLRERIWDQYVIIANSPEGPQQITLDLPDAKAVAEFTAAVDRLVTTHANLERIGAARSSDVAKAALTQMQQALEALAAAIDEKEGE
jgi:hypothetical protein